MKTVKLITPSDLSDDFKVSGGKVHLSTAIKQYKVDFAVAKNIATTNNPVDYERQERRQLTLHSSGVGKIHLDFKMLVDSGPSRTIYMLPANAPTSLELIEFAFADGGTIWLGAGSRNIVANGLKANSRYIVDLVGFFA
uniref:Uncharacterized protein n=1 Tax=Podoviridae sp. ct53O25 TaxID=2826539 RepID=A0A8S5MBM8_9CAUD|nr:MAG TPA: hypothetical protein [Podoviridae sp. ct53O25]